MVRLTDEQCIALYAATLNDEGAVDAMLDDAMSRAADLAREMSALVESMSMAERALFAHFIAASVQTTEGDDAGDAA